MENKESPATGRDILDRITLAEVLEWCEEVKARFNLDSFGVKSSFYGHDRPWVAAYYKGEALGDVEILSDIEILKGEIDGHAEELKAAKIEKLRAEIAELEASP